MFYDCSSLSSLPDISKWNVENLLDAFYMFGNCISLKSLPDFSKWKFKNENIKSFGMLSGLTNISFLPNISNLRSAWFESESIQTLNKNIENE